MDEQFNKKVGIRLFNRRKEEKMTRAELGKKLNLHETTVKKYEDGLIKSLDIDKLKEFAKALHTTPAYLMGWTEEETNFEDYNLDIIPLETKKFPLLGTVACGEPIYADEEHDAYICASSTINADFCLRAKGDSMIGAKINDGDIVFIKKQPIVEDGEIAVVLVDDEATLKRVFFDRENRILMLYAENPNIKPLRFVGDELNKVRILGKAVLCQFVVK